MYIVVSWWEDGGRPTVEFSNSPYGAIMLSNDSSQSGMKVTVYEITQTGMKLVFGKQLQKTIHDGEII